MTDYGHDLRFGSFITPTNHSPDAVVELAQVSERAGLDLATFQDHPYQSAFLDTWTLLSFVAARTERIGVAGNVMNLPLRHPAVLARAVASLDHLSGGRVELGLGAGGFWDAIEAMGTPRLSPGESVTALEEAIDVIQGIWDTTSSDRLVAGGKHHHLDGAKRGPAPVHQVEIWLGALKPRMLRLIGRKADGWLPSLSFLGSVEELGRSSAIIDEAAGGAGRRPEQIRRLLNINGQFTEKPGTDLLHGPPQHWAEQLADLTLQFGTSTFILGSDNAEDIATFGQEVAPTVRELVAAERGAPTPSSAQAEAETIR